MKELFVEAKVENLDAVMDFVTVELDAVGCQNKLQTRIAIAVEEIFVNIAHYAYNPGIGDVSIRVAVGDGAASIEFKDSGKPYNPLEKEDPDIISETEMREVGGLGIFMVKKIMDSVEYSYEDGKNILVIKKRLYEGK